MAEQTLDQTLSQTAEQPTETKTIGSDNFEYQVAIFDKAMVPRTDQVREEILDEIDSGTRPKPEPKIETTTDAWIAEDIGEKERYYIGEKIDSGGYASVYKAYDAKLDKYVALKIKTDNGDFSVDGIQEIEAKAVIRAIERLSSEDRDSVIRIDDFFISEEIPGYENKKTEVIVMEYLDPEEYEFLHKLLDRQKRFKKDPVQDNEEEPFPLSSLTETFLNAARTYDALCDQKIFHGDIDTKNLAVQKKTNKIKATDFGNTNFILKQRQHQGSKLKNMPPELFSDDYNQGRIDRAPLHTQTSEVWSFASTLFEAYTGLSPFSEDPIGILNAENLNEKHKKAIENKLANNLYQDQPDLEKLKTVFLKAFKINPEERYQTMTELASDFVKALNLPNPTTKKRAPFNP